ncbi:MAG: HEPN domain-containing protein [Planctomycetes bacterium]|nr:HEPN domain-containing protein [Planctomycetota bacterium]
MNLKAIDKMVAEKRLRKLSKPPFDQVDRLLAASQRDLGNVRKFLAIDETKAYDTAYDVMFKSALALMRAHGYRPGTTLQHKTTVEFCEAVLEPSWKATLDYLDDMRQKRNRLTYEGDVVIGRAEAETAIAEAEKFRTAIVKIIDDLRRSS